MEWPVIVAIAVLVPIFLFPAALVWYVNVTGIFEVWNDRRKKAGAKKATATAK